MEIIECLCCGETWKNGGTCPNCGSPQEEHVVFEDAPIPGLISYA